MRLLASPALCLLQVLLIALWAQHAVSIPHVNDCNYCTHCLLEDSITAAAQRTLHAVEQPAPGARPHDLPRASSERQQDEEELRQVMYRLSGNTGSGSASRVLGGAGSAGKAPSSAMHPIASAAWGHGLGPNMGSVSPVLHSPHNLSKSMIRPSDHQAKMLKPNCTRCYGCTTNLTDIKDEVRTFDRIKFVHGMGATNAWLFFAQPKGSAKRYIVKVFCMPYAKTHGRPKECSPLVYMDRVRLMMAHVALARDCGAPELTPRWVPGMRWHSLWMDGCMRPRPSLRIRRCGRAVATCMPGGRLPPLPGCDAGDQGKSRAELHCVCVRTSGPFLASSGILRMQVPGPWSPCTCCASCMQDVACTCERGCAQRDASGLPHPLVGPVDGGGARHHAACAHGGAGLLPHA